MECQSKIKKGMHFIHATTWINLKGFMLSERASFKAFYIISFIWHYWTDKTIVMENSSVVARGLVWGEGVSVKQLHERLYWGYGIFLNPDRAFSSVQLLSRVWLCDPMNRSTPGLPVHHHLPEFTQTHVHRVRDAIQPSHPRLSPSPPALNPSQHQSLFQWVNSLHEVAKVLEFQL